MPYGGIGRGPRPGVRGAPFGVAKDCAGVLTPVGEGAIRWLISLGSGALWARLPKMRQGKGG